MSKDVDKFDDFEKKVTVNTATFLTYINQEITNLKREIEQPGWTEWAVLGSLAAIIWLFLDLVEGINNWAQVYLVLLILLIAQHVITIAISLIQYEQIGESGNIRFRTAKNYLRMSRVGLLILAIRCIVPILLTFRFAPAVSNLTNILVVILFGLFLLPVIVIFVFSYLETPLPINIFPKKGNIILINGLMLFASIYPLVQYIRFARSSFLGITIVDIKLSLIILAVFSLINLLFQKPISGLIIKSLENIRRDVVFENISIEDAKKQTEIAILGGRIADVFEKDISKILDYLGVLNARIFRIGSNIDKLIEQFNKYGENLSDDEMEIQSSIMREMIIGLRDSLISSDDLKKAYDVFHRKTNFLLNFAGISNELILEVIEKITPAINESNERAKENINKYIKYLITIESDKPLEDILKKYGMDDESIKDFLDKEEYI